MEYQVAPFLVRWLENNGACKSSVSYGEVLVKQIVFISFHFILDACVIGISFFQ